MNTASPHIAATLERIQSTDASPLEQAEALVDVAMDLQRKPRHPQELFDAIFLYDHAARLSEDVPLARARAISGKGTALRRIPGAGVEHLEGALTCFEDSLPVLQQQGEPEELAEVEMNYGLVLQTLAGVGKAQLPLAIQAYHRALRFFTASAYPQEFAILHNNLATAYLSTTMAADKEGVREALAVQSFKEALKAVTLEEAPVEYSMLQNNLGNALQATRTNRSLENLAEAVVAYDEALKVRTRADMPVEYANTIANKANALMNLPDDPSDMDKGNPENTAAAAALLEEAAEVFAASGIPDRAQIVAELATSLRADLEKR